MGRAPCCDKANVKRGPWSPEEDETLRNYVQTHGTGGNWIALPKKAGLKRCGKSCRLRWLNYLRPDIKHGDFTEEEDTIICSLYNEIGSRWSVIASHLSGRTDNDVKNYWNTKLKKKLQAGKISLTSNLTTANNETLISTNNNHNAMTINFQNNMPPQPNIRQIDHQLVFGIPPQPNNNAPQFTISTGWCPRFLVNNDFQDSVCYLSGNYYHPRFNFAEPETSASRLEFSGNNNNMSTSSSSVSNSSSLGVDSNNVLSLHRNDGFDGCFDNCLMNLGSNGEFSLDMISEFLLGERSS